MNTGNDGIELYKLFQDLGINTGKIGLNEINAWYESDSDTLEFLNWIKTSINTDNILSAQENEDFNDLVEKDLVLNEDELKSCDEKLLTKYTDLCDIQSNECQIDILKDELSMHKGHEIYLNQQITINEKLNNKLKIALSKTNAKEKQEKIKLDEIKKNCLGLATNLDDANIKLQDRIIKCGESLIAFENCFEEPLFFSNMNLEDFSTDIDIILSKQIQERNKLLNLDTLLECEYPQNESILNSEIEGALDTMLNRISKSLFKSIKAKAEYEEVNAVLKYLNSLNLADLSYNFNANYPFHLEAVTLARKQKNNLILLNLENACKESAKKYIMLPKLICTQKDNTYLSKHIEINSEIENKINKLLSYYFILFLFFEIENNDIKTTDKFFKDISDFITYDLHNNKIRIANLITTINEYNIYKNKPFEEKYKLINDILVFIGSEKNDAINLDSAIDIVNEFRNSSKNLERKVFSDDFDLFKDDCKDIELQISVMKKFLISGPTAALITIPYELFKVFEEVKDAISYQDNYMKSIMMIPSEYQKKIAQNQWLRYRRQLWMYFITEPKKVLSIISQISNEVLMKRNEFI